MSRSYGVDVAVYQPTSMEAYKANGAKFMIVKLTEGTGYFNPKAHYQIQSAHANHMYVHAYHYANFGNSATRARAEAKYFLNRARTENISKKRYLWLDWESGGNSVTGSRSSNTSAIIEFMKICHNAGYKVGLYSGASLLRNNIDSKQVIKRFGNCLWVASYATMGRIDTPNFNYFPSMDGVAIWQFTDNWRGLNADGNIALIELHGQSKDRTADKKPTKKVESEKAKIPKVVYAPVINNNANYMIQLLDGDSHYTGKYIKTNSRWKVFGEKTIKGMKCYKLGTDKQWVPAKFVKVVE